TGRLRYTSGVDAWHGKLDEIPKLDESSRPRVRPAMRPAMRPSVRPAARDVAATIARFAELVPAAADVPIEEIWGGLIDQAPDALPVLDRAEDPAGLCIAVGFSGHGFCLGPVTGRIIASIALDEPTGFDLAPFRRDRFARWNARAEPVSLHG
ncbi:MAG: FAD-binding oxidoreductase, partial [Acetobacteraceae bacterium]|nr:FAD-binding oxidoreductase [Acetobacteraceae bacterium]